MRQCIFIIGTRAQLIKVAPVLRLAVELRLPHKVWFTGQHRESIDDLIGDFKLTSTILMPAKRRERSSIGRLLTWMPSAFFDCGRYLRGVTTFERSAPLVVVHGDTLSTLIGALAGRRAGASIVHMESGLSSMRLLDPFPEEILRRLTFRLTRYALCPNAEATLRMRRQGRSEVVDTGDNTMLDCVRYAIEENKSTIGRNDGRYFVASIHRFENIYRTSYLSRIVDDIIAASADGTVYFVLHPPTERKLRKSGLLQRLQQASGVKLEPRIPFTRFLALIAGARGVFSDGGSNQEELSYLGVPTVLFRERSERPDGFGANVVLRKDVGPSLSRFIGSGGLDRLRRPCRLADKAEPSLVTVQALVKWSTCTP